MTNLSAQQGRDELPPLPDKDDCCVHIYPSDLERMRCSETVATVFSVAVISLDERSIPLYTAEQMRAYAQAARAQAREPVIGELHVSFDGGYSRPVGYYVACRLPDKRFPTEAEALAFIESCRTEGAEDKWLPFVLTLELALNRGDDPRLLLDENSPLRDELRQIIVASRAASPMTKKEG